MKKRIGPHFPSRTPRTSHIKPERFSDYLTIGELARVVRKDISWIKRLERAGRIPQAKRVQLGELSFRLYSPAQVKEIEGIFKTMKVGRPRRAQ